MDEEEVLYERKRTTCRSSERQTRFSFMALLSRSVDLENDSSPEVSSSDPTFLDLLRLNRPEWYWIVLGSMCAVLVSGSIPLFSICFSDIIHVLAQPVEKMLHDSVFWSLVFLVLGAVIGIGFALEMLFLSVSGELLTQRLRSVCFMSILDQDVQYFEQSQNCTGSLITILSKDASLIQGQFSLACVEKGSFKTLF